MDDWWENGMLPKFGDADIVIFRGSLGNANRIVAELDWCPGAICATNAFYCSSYYEHAKRWLLHEKWAFSTVEAMVAEPTEIAGKLARENQVFVRPDSPLKPFSGRVISLNNLTLESLDFGFYYDDSMIPVVIAPIKTILREWRFVVADREVVAGCAYNADDHSAMGGDVAPAMTMAIEIARKLEPPDPVYILDLCETDDGIRLLELNPFSGADLYSCDPDAVVFAVEQVIRRMVVNGRGVT
ncbi:MAG: ATP-grasp domain-containing protein [Planctomycetaceae bacterium]